MATRFSPIIGSKKKADDFSDCKEGLPLVCRRKRGKCTQGTEIGLRDFIAPTLLIRLKRKRGGGYVHATETHARAHTKVLTDPGVSVAGGSPQDNTVFHRA